MRRVLENPSVDQSWLGQGDGFAASAGQGSGLRLAEAMQVDDAWLGGGNQKPADANLAATNQTLALMVQSMAGFGATAASSDLLKRQISIDAGVDWLAVGAA